MGTIFDEYLKARSYGDARNAQTLNMGLGVLNAQQMLRQAAMEEQMQPLKLAQLRTAVEQARQNAQLRGILQGQLTGGAVSPQDALSTGAAQGDVGPTNTNAARIGAPAAGGGSLAGVNPLAAALMLSGDAGMGKVGSAIQESTKPMVVTEGGSVFVPGVGPIYTRPKIGENSLPVLDTQGNVIGVRPLPGATDVLGGVRRAEEGARAAYDLMEIPGVGRMSRLDALNRLSPGASAPAPRPGPRTPTPAGFPSVSPEEQAARDAEAARIRAAEGQPGGGGLIPSRNVLGGYVPTEAEKAAEKARAEGRAKSGVDFENSVLEAGRTARTNLTQLQILAPNLDKLPTGPIYNTMLSGAALFKQFGIDIGEIGKQVGPAQASEAVLNRMALAVRNPAGGEGMPGAMSEQDREYLVKTIPNLSKTPDGNRILIKILSGLEQRKIDEAAIVSRMQQAGKNSNEIREALTQFANSRSLLQGIR